MLGHQLSDNLGDFFTGGIICSRNVLNWAMMKAAARTQRAGDEAMLGFQSRIVERATESLRPYEKNARTHSRKQIQQIARSIERFGFTNPVLVSDDGEILAGHGRVAAAKLLGLKFVPTIGLSHLSPTERRAYVLADNKLALNAGWDRETLAIELQALIDLDFDVEVTGFSTAEVDLTLEEARESAVAGCDAPEDQIPLPASSAVTKRGDLWQLGRHRLICGDARDKADYVALMGREAADLIFTDPPYNVPIDGHEPPRVCRRPQFLRGWGYGSEEGKQQILG
jgi:hypothetical protein